jgi:hypothetical protein
MNEKFSRDLEISTSARKHLANISALETEKVIDFGCHVGRAIGFADEMPVVWNLRIGRSQITGGSEKLHLWPLFMHFLGEIHPVQRTGHLNICKQ